MAISALRAGAKSLTFLVGRNAPVADKALPRGTVVLPGSFNPLHNGHLALARAAQAQAGAPVVFEISARSGRTLSMAVIANTAGKWHAHILMLCPIVLARATL